MYGNIGKSEAHKHGLELRFITRPLIVPPTMNFRNLLYLLLPHASGNFTSLNFLTFIHSRTLIPISHAANHHNAQNVTPLQIKIPLMDQSCHALLSDLNHV